MKSSSPACLPGSSRGRIAGLAVLCAATLGGAVARAQALPPAPAAAAPAQESCAEVKIGSERSYGCLNRMFEEEARQGRQVLPVPSPAGAPAPANGGYNQAETRQRLGTSFGVSAIPQSHPKTQYVSPLLGR